MLNDNDSPASAAEEGRDARTRTSPLPSAPARNRRDLGKISLVISLLSLVLVTIFFFGLNRNLAGLSREVQDVDSMKHSVASLDAYVDDILGQMGRINAQLLDMDERRRAEVVRILMQSMLDDMVQKTSFLAEQLGNAPEAAKLDRIRSLLLELRRPAPARGVVAPQPGAHVAPPAPAPHPGPVVPPAAAEQGAPVPQAIQPPAPGAPAVPQAVEPPAAPQPPAVASPTPALTPPQAPESSAVVPPAAPAPTPQPPSASEPEQPGNDAASAAPPESMVQ